MKTEDWDTAISSIGQRLEFLRIKKGFSSSKEFADKYGLPAMQYWKMEKGKAQLTFKSLMRVLQIHDLTLEDFFCLRVTNVAA